MRGVASLQHPARILICLLHTVTIITQLLVLNLLLHLTRLLTIANLTRDHLLLLLKHHLQNVRVSITNNGSRTFNVQTLVRQFHIDILRLLNKAMIENVTKTNKIK